MSRRVVIAGVVASLVLAGCTPDEDADDAPTEIFTSTEEPTEATATPTATEEPSTAAPSPTASPSPSDPFAVPDEITPEYAERVINELSRIDADVTRAILSSPVDQTADALPPELREQVASVYGGRLFTQQLAQDMRLLQSQDERDDLLAADEVDQLRTSIEVVLAGEPCLLVRGKTDRSGVDADVQEEPILGFYYLEPAPSENPTGWKLVGTLSGAVGDDRLPEDEVRTYTAEGLRSQAPVECQ